MNGPCQLPLRKKIKRKPCKEAYERERKDVRRRNQPQSSRHQERATIKALSEIGTQASSTLGYMK